MGWGVRTLCKMDLLGQHTIFTIFIYVVLAIKSEANSTNVGIVVKMSLCFLLIIVMYEVPGVFKPLFRYIHQALSPTPLRALARLTKSISAPHQNPAWRIDMRGILQPQIHTYTGEAA
jgi:hypothetical protein